MSNESDDTRDLRRLRTAFLIGTVVFAIAIRLVPYLLMALGVALDHRVTTYPWNFSPLTTVCLFGAVYALRPSRSFVVPLVILVVGDVGIGLVSGRLDYAVYGAQPFVYGGHLLSVALALLLVRSRRTLSAAVGTGLLAECTFFAVSNLGVWAMGSTYPHDLGGLSACYVAAIPFFRNSLIATAFYAPTLFAGYAFVERRIGVTEALQSADTE